MDPENPYYLGTRAEVHFRRGEVEKAVELQKRALKLKPNDSQFQDQLKRFQPEKPPTKPGG